jgi:prepilin-type N-terminal cleavage/methylation domain-containing protein
MKSTQKGFTLVEIAIVLVIIGLLLGGILKGQEMITQAKTKNVIADFSGVSAAYHGYLDRYRALPGDDNGAGRWGATTTIAGSGNGTVAGTYNNSCTAALSGTTPESCLFWHHLRLAGFVGGTGWAQPFNAVNGVVGVQTGNGAATPAAVLTGTTPGFSSLILCSANLPDKIAIAVDNQMDDGDMRIGSVRGQLNSAPNPAISATVDTAVNYAETGTNLYTLCRAL